jgi:cytosine/adenosine deaminase-related metal-dependent hydrolase
MMAAAVLYRSRFLLPIGAPPLEDGALLVAAGRMLAVGPYAELAAAHPRAAVVDFGEAVILPPLVNAHTHLELTGYPVWAAAADAAEPTPGDFVDWILQLVRVRRNVPVAAVRAALATGLQESLAAGTGAVGDILTILAAADAYAASPLRGRVFCEVLGVDAAPVALRLAEIGALLDAPPGRWLSWGISPHAPYTLNRETFSQVHGFADRHRLPLACHWAETGAEVEFLTRLAGPLATRLYPAAGWSPPALPPGLAIPLRPAAAGGLLIHGVHADAPAIAAVAASGHGLVLCPRSNSRFGAARAPVATYRRAGVVLALGTDSRASSPSLSVWEELAFARSWFSGALDPQSWLEIATLGGASLLGLADRFGRLQPGGEASFQVVAVPSGAVAANLAEALCAAGTEIAVKALVLGGENVLPPGLRPPIINRFASPS